MGEQKVSLLSDQKSMKDFVKKLLNDVQALEYMLENDWFESDNMHIGAEQEMVLVDTTTFRPACIAMEALEKMKEYPWVETELARFNLEINLTPRPFEKKCLSLLEEENRDHLNKISEKLKDFNADVLLTGILPTLHKFDLEMHNLTPKKRYFALMEAINNQLIGSSYELRLKGIDEILVKHNSPLLEACNTSFQVHLQVKPKNFVKMYNISQALAGPIIAISANSPIVFGKRLWHETRIALFQQALDVRTTHNHMRDRSPRVSFGNSWLEDSIMEIYKEDIARFRVLLSADVEEDSLDLIGKGKVPLLRALQVHNSTVYRWNRPCYGISANGKPHLRIENRVLASGPTIQDEVANAAFWLGCMVALRDECEDIRQLMSFEDVRDNFAKAVRFGIDTKFTWFNDEKITAADLIVEKLIPLARKGLKQQNVDAQDIDKYLGIIEARAKNHMNGARWQLRAYTGFIQEVSQDEALTVLTASIYKNQKLKIPVHNWDMPKLTDLKNYTPSVLKVSEFMTTDLFTVQKEDILEMVAEIMDWRRIRYIPVEDAKGKLVGLITARLLLRHYVKEKRSNIATETTVKDVMIKDPVTISPSATILEAMDVMRKEKIGSIPVVSNGDLIGLITDMDFLRISTRLIERLGQKND